MVEHADYAAVAAAIREQLLAYAAEVWAAATLDDEGLARLVELMVPTVQAAQEQIASYTSVYFGEVTGTDPVAVSSDVVDGRGVPAEQVYARPIVTARTELSRGRSVEKALDAGGRRLQNLAGTDVQMAKVRQADVSLQVGGVKFFRRVLTGRENCGLCVIASTQRYRRGNLLPIHPGCDCDIDVLPPGVDLDQVIDVDLLNSTHDQVKAFAGVADRGGRAVDYRKLIVTHEHGEVGPVLAWRGQQFTSKADLK